MISGIPLINLMQVDSKYKNKHDIDQGKSIRWRQKNSPVHRSHNEHADKCD